MNDGLLYESQFKRDELRVKEKMVSLRLNKDNELMRDLKLEVDIQCGDIVFSLYIPLMKEIKRKKMRGFYKKKEIKKKKENTAGAKTLVAYL